MTPSPRPARQLVIDAIALYRRFPLLFLTLAAGVIVPFQAIVLVATGTGPLGRSALSLGTSLLLTLIEWVVIAPLVSALHVHAVREVREGREPRLLAVAGQGLRVLPVVMAAAIISGLGVALGFLAFLVPGLFLLLRWYVVAQTAAIERQGWLPALRRSGELTKGHYGHVFAFTIYVGLIGVVPTFLAGLAFEQDSTNAASFLVGVAVGVCVSSFGALAAALLYFDLRALLEPRAQQTTSMDSGLPGDDRRQPNHALDPRMYSDQTRPSGWYVNPDSPGRMHYWESGGSAGWKGSTRTPRAIRKSWRADARE
jgi:hypothetical protein